METPVSKYWLDIVVAQIEAAHPKGDLIVESGHSPSGNYHVGFLREFIISSAIAAKLREHGRVAKHLDFVDDFDVLRKVPANVSPDWERYLGQPLYLVPDPFGDCHSSYGDHFLGNLYVSLKQLGAEFESMRASVEYPRGIFTDSIEKSLSRLDDAKRIIAEVSHRQLGEDWSPVQILSDQNSLRDWQYTGWDKAKQVVRYEAQSGETGEISYTAGRVKLDWRLDWPARWAFLGISAEPFGRDHASKGGSYDTGSVLVRDIFGGQPPFPIPYEFVNLLGQTKKMSKSAGDVMTPADALEIMPPEIVRYFLGKARPAKTLFFDSGLGLYNLVDEYAKVEADALAGRDNEFKEAYQFAAQGSFERKISSVPFSHLVSVYQAALGNHEVIWRLLERTGYEAIVRDQKKVIETELTFVKNWLEKYAPPEVKFTVTDKLSPVELSDDQKAFLAALSEADLETGLKDAQSAHDLIYETIQNGPVKPPEAFQALYQVLIGQNSGPRAGAFLATLAELKGQSWLISRLLLEA